MVHEHERHAEGRIKVPDPRSKRDNAGSRSVSPVELRIQGLAGAVIGSALSVRLRSEHLFIWCEVLLDRHHILLPSSSANRWEPPVRIQQ